MPKDKQFLKWSLSWLRPGLFLNQGSWDNERCLSSSERRKSQTSWQIQPQSGHNSGAVRLSWIKALEFGVNPPRHPGWGCWVFCLLRNMFVFHAWGQRAGRAASFFRPTLASILSERETDCLWLKRRRKVHSRACLNTFRDFQASSPPLRQSTISATPQSGPATSRPAWSDSHGGAWAKLLLNQVFDGVFRQWGAWFKPSDLNDSKR